ncbi:hypothetical protein QJS10_CPB04g01252 [Acorus calamus]|uniref:Uncharacterized protein n=1 Tax=Acorus calamus TaxID=4465 RepID=A0AAV9F3P9_ACOCL|nr:hypothetical protein QJS10_CPB04g01252 [Acorus calamus]
MSELQAVMTSLTRRGDKSTKARIHQQIIPADLWAIWLTRNSVTFKNQRFYPENLWATTCPLLLDWGTHLAGATQVTLAGGALHTWIDTRRCCALPPPPPHPPHSPNLLPSKDRTEGCLVTRRWGHLTVFDLSMDLSAASAAAEE